MGCHLVMAVRPFDEGKTRLSEVLTKAERISLNYKFLYHSFLIAQKVFPPERIVVVSRGEAQLKAARIAGAHALPEQGDGLNAALGQGARDAVARGATAILSLSSDLPYLTADDLSALLADPAEIVIATDVARRGTNALLQRSPFAIPYGYGADSLTTHRTAAEAIGLTVSVIARPGLARDIDTPADLDELRASHPEFF